MAATVAPITPAASRATGVRRLHVSPVSVAKNDGQVAVRMVVDTSDEAGPPLPRQRGTRPIEDHAPVPACLPIVFATDTGDTVAAAHGRLARAGSRCDRCHGGSAMAVQPEHLIAWLGPAIGRRISKSVGRCRGVFERRFRAGDAFKANAEAKFMADLGMLARRQLKDLGVNRIYGGGECTYARADRYFFASTRWGQGRKPRSFGEKSEKKTVD